MKKILLIAAGMIMLGLSSQAQEMQYLFQGKDGKSSVSGFAGIFNEFSGFDGEFAFSMGGGAALLIDQKFFLGGYGMGVTTRHLRDFTWYDKYLEKNVSYYDLYTRFGHGGFWLGYIHQPRKAVNFGVNAKLGWGAITLTDKLYKDYDDNWYNYMSDNVFVINPEIDVNLNLLKWMRASFGFGYRWVTGVDEKYAYKDPNLGPEEKRYFKEDAFNSFTGNITLAFGWFGN